MALFSLRKRQNSKKEGEREHKPVAANWLSAFLLLTPLETNTSPSSPFLWCLWVLLISIEKPPKEPRFLIRYSSLLNS
ncbi:hypothetical protein L6452_34561 [Arctium lappa]|uniref:Uncharacterized protein n=1 Tax=Arctium lappa TaxID=4217 RepID=A0ACB8YHT1_ARCLA|nr:hypothetical protein L6452_34561 [Arctium lappa]